MTVGRCVATVGITAASCLTVALALAAQSAPGSGVQDPSWSPDGRRLATSFYERIWISAADGRSGRPLRASSTAIERDPVWSPDGRSIVFAADEGKGYDLYSVAEDGKGTAKRLTTTDGDERWPSYTRDGRIVFSRRAHAFEPWRLFVVSSDGGEATPLFNDSTGDTEREPRVSPDGTRVAYISDRESDDGDVDLWVADLAPVRGRVQRVRITRVRGREAYPAWSPDGTRLAYFVQQDGAASVWVAPFDPPGAADSPRVRPSAQAILVSRRGGAPAWSPDGGRIAIASLPSAEPTYNGNPLREDSDPPPAFGSAGFALWLVDAPRPVDAGARQLTGSAPSPQQLLRVFDRTWETLRRMYYAGGASASEWTALRDKYRPQAAAARTEGEIEAAVDAMVAEQPLIKAPVTSTQAVVVSGHPLASKAGLAALEKGGNIVDAAVAVSFALGVVEPDASGLGGDGMALLFLKGMSEPVVIDYKDQFPIHATSDNAALRANQGDGAGAANIPGVVAGLDHLYRTYGSKKVAWADLIAPAIDYADGGYVLDEALPTSIAEGRSYFEKYAEAKKIFLPGGRVPKPGDRFVNRDYATTLRAIAKDPQTFYRGDLARRIAADMAKNGGLITVDDLAQYRAIERRPLSGEFRGHRVFSTPPPVSTGLQLIETLQILDNYRPAPGATYATNADYFHYAIESWKVRDQGGRIADPALWTVDLGPHLNRDHAATLFKRIDPKKASRMGGGPPEGAGTPPERIGRGTTAFAVADADGNMIAVTQTLSTWGGTFYVSEGLGFLYNNHLRFGGGAAPGRFLPLARSSTTSVPTLVFKDGAPVLGVAAAGNAWIPASVYDVILNVIDGGLPAQRAIEAPRFLIGRDPLENAVGRMQIEDRFPASLLNDLTARGHRFTKIGRKGEVRYGYAAAVVRDPVKGEVQAGAEPRRSHGAAGR